MANIRFTATHLSDLTAAGRLKDLRHDVIAPFLERELGTAYGRLFAEFVMEASDVRAWYVDADTKPRPIADLTSDERTALLQRVAGMIEKILDFAGRISGGSAQKADLARQLVAATTFPIEDLWEVGGQPLIVNWGFHRQTFAEGPPKIIAELIKPPPPPPPVLARSEAPRARSDFGWLPPLLLWPLFLVILAACYVLLLPACGIDRRWPILSELGVLNACRLSTPFDEARREGNRLQVLVEQEELRVAQHLRQCAIAARQGTPPPVHRADRPPHPDETPPQDPERLERDVERRLPHDAPRGAVEVSLLWDNEADLDLIIECPGGDKLWHDSSAFQACGGQLTRDVNKAGDTLLQHPIEHAWWPTSPQGTFTIKVQLWTYNTVPAGTDIPFTIRISRGNDVKVIEGGHIKGARTMVTSTTTNL